MQRCLFNAAALLKDSRVRVLSRCGRPNAQVERVAVGSLDARPPSGCEGYVMYLRLYSAEYHTEPVPP